MAALRVEKKERRKWNEDEQDILIDLYEARPYLWDIFCKEYSKRDAKEKALNEISEQLDVSVEEVKFRFRDFTQNNCCGRATYHTDVHIKKKL